MISLGFEPTPLVFPPPVYILKPPALPSELTRPTLSDGIFVSVKKSLFRNDLSNHQNKIRGGYLNSSDVT